jgi:aspartyl-tRNA(Asn)/glutamyl-tRNA(Gln) amidotransferase subunit A
MALVSAPEAPSSLPTLSSLAASLRAGEGSAVALVEQALAAAEAQADLNIFTVLDHEGARAAAHAADAAFARGEDLGPLQGIPVAVKDNICVAGLPTTCGSRFLESFSPPDNATVVNRLKLKGAVIIGKTNCDEFAMGSSNENSAYGPVKNPRDPSRVPGGSSGGSAAAVAAGIVPLALGSDTGGSIRQPAAFCGVVGLKPTWGRVSRSGLVAFGSSLDQVGPFASDVAGAAALLAVIAGPDPLDSTTIQASPSADLADAADPGTPLRVGVPAEYLEGLSDEGRQVIDRSLAALTATDVVPVSLPHTRYAIATYYVLASAEASSNLARFDGVRYGRRAGPAEDGLDALYMRSRTEGFGPEVQRRIMLGTFVLSAGYYDAYYGKAQAARRVIGQDFKDVFEAVDLVVSLTAPTTAFALGAKTQDPLAMYLSDIFTVPASLAGLPAISVPVGNDSDGLPWGLQIIAPLGEEVRMLRFASRVEAALEAGG